jgi:hypothetical protein
MVNTKTTIFLNTVKSVININVLSAYFQRKSTQKKYCALRQSRKRYRERRTNSLKSKIIMSGPTNQVKSKAQSLLIIKKVLKLLANYSKSRTPVPLEKSQEKKILSPSKKFKNIFIRNTESKYLTKRQGIFLCANF